MRNPVLIIKRPSFTMAAALLLLALPVLWGACTPAAQQTLRRLPGAEAVTGPTPPIYSTAILGLRVPQGVAVTAAGDRLYVAEGDGDRGIKVIDLRTRSALGTLSPPATSPGTRKPLAVAVGPNGIVYAVDRLRLVVDMYDPQGRWLGLLAEPGTPPGQWEPLGVAISPQGNIFVTSGSSAGPFMAQYSPEGRLVRTFTNKPGELPFSFPASITMVRNNFIAVADSNNGRVAVLDTQGNFIRAYGNTVGPETLAIPRGSAFDGRGYVYVTDATNHDVKVWNTATDPAIYIFKFGDGGIADGEFLYPNAIAVDGNNRLYIADTGNDRVQIWSY